MAELDVPAGKNRHKNSLRLGKKLSTKVDLTPMVDLGFLLITFFMVTTAWTKPHATDLKMPAKGDSSNLGENAVLTILLGNNNKAFYYTGSLDESLKENSCGITGYSLQDGIGEIIRHKQSHMDEHYKGGRKEMMVLIKPSADASYENIVQLLDEMLINKVGRYAIIDLNDEEKKLLKQKNLMN
jgi:biopolymer transport protein ExbD